MPVRPPEAERKGGKNNPKSVVTTVYNILAILFAAGILYQQDVTLSLAGQRFLMSLSMIIVASNAQLFEKRI